MQFIHRNSIITDEKGTCRFSDIKKHFEKIEMVLHRNGVGKGAPVALFCNNGLPGALTLSYLLEAEYSVLVIGMERVGNPNDFPSFCRFKIVAGYGNCKTDQFEAENYLRIFENNNYATVDFGWETGPKLLLMTSGSTGISKIAVHSHMMIKKNAENCVARLELDKKSRIAIPVPIIHMYGLGAAFLPGMLIGASVDLQVKANLLKFIQREKIFNPNTAFMTPIFCETLLKGRRSSRHYDLTVIAGDRFRSNEIFKKYESLFGRLVNLYGSTEMGAISAAKPKDPFTMRMKTSGNPMDGVIVSMEKENRKNAMEGQSVLWCKHPYGFDGYIDESGPSAGKSFQNSKGWFCTKDIGRILADGSIQIFGRSDHSVNRDGLLVAFGDVESHLQTMDGIDSAIVVSKGESKRGKKMIACVIPRKGVVMEESNVRTLCFDIMPNRAVPDKIVFMTSFPLLTNGKVDRQKLVKMIEK